MTCDVCEALKIQESIVQFSCIYEEMEIFDDEFYVEPSLDSKNLPERRNVKHLSEIHLMT